MAQVTRLGLYGGPRAPYATFAAVVTASVTGSFTEAQIVAGSQEITITLVSDTWVADDGTFAGIRQDIIDGLDSAQSETLGWNNEVRDKEVVGSVVRTSDTVVTITLTASASYDITADETITVTVPASAMTSTAVPITATPTIGVSVVAVEDDQPSGGYLYVRYEQEQLRREEERRLRARALRKAKRIKDKLHRELALAERKIDEETARKAELARINRLVADNQQAIIELDNPVIIKAMNEALESQTFSRIERLERELGKIYEEEMFLLEATKILVNQ